MKKSIFKVEFNVAEGATLQTLVSKGQHRVGKVKPDIAVPWIESFFARLK
jgi:hypothetical protein